MVLSAVLRDPARHPQQTPWRDRTRYFDNRLGFHAMARYLAGAFGQLPAALPAVFVHLLRRRHWTRLSRLTGAGGWLCDRGTHSHHLLFRLLLCDSAAAGPVRENQAAAEFDLRIGTPAGHFSRCVGAATPTPGRLVRAELVRLRWSCTPMGAAVHSPSRGFAVSPLDEFRPSTAQHSMCRESCAWTENLSHISQMNFACASAAIA